MNLAVSPADIEAHYEVLSRIGAIEPGGAKGFLRAAYSDEETEAMKHFERAAVALGLAVRWDAAGNLALERPGTGPDFLEIGSHLDTVPAGGNFDGAAGIVAGFEAIRRALAANPTPKHGLRLRIWRGEESSTYGSVYTGSKAAFGKLSPLLLDNEFRGKTLAEAMRSQGVDPAMVARGEPTISQREIDRIKLHIELHIEQGNLLEVSGKDIGVVTGIRGPRRYRVVLEGSFDHSGATPLGVKYRKDVNLALGYIIVELDRLAKGALAAGVDLVQTIGVVNCDRDFNARHPEVYENTLTKVSGYGYFTIDFRSVSQRVLEEYSVRAHELIRREAERFDVRCSIDGVTSGPPLEHIGRDVISRCEAACRSAGASFVQMPSGGGHDAAVVGQQLTSAGTEVPIGMLFIPCRGGKSHCPEEFASFEAIAKGATALAHLLSQALAE